MIEMVEKEVFMDRMSWKDLEKAIAEDYIIALAIGSTEQHGPHLPLGVDVFGTLGIVERVARKVKMVIAPPITYGYYSQPRSGGGQTFIGTTSVSSSTLLGLIYDLMTEFLRHGFKKILIVNGHYENAPFISEGLEKAIADSGRKDVKAMIINWWEPIPKEVVDKVFPEGFPGWDVEHASVVETSIMMVLKPELVQTDKIRDNEAERRIPYDIIPTPPEVIPKSGVLWRATLASKDKGELVIETAVDKIVEAIEKDLA